MAKRRIWARHAVRSGLEKRIKDWLEESTIPFEYEPTSFKYTTEHKYTPDFLVNNIYIESKGLFDSQSRGKMLAVKKAHPNLDIRLLFQRDQPIRKGSKTLYSQWAEKNGFLYAIIKDEKKPEIPREWL